MEYVIVPAAEEDRDEILSLYHAQLGREYCPWTEEYPSATEIDRDLSRDALFVMKTGGRICAAVSIEEDEAVGGLSFWNQELMPEGELARLAVLPKLQNKGIGRAMMQYGMDELKRRGFRGIRFLVNRHNIKAVRSFVAFSFTVAGECYIYGQEMLCYEKEL